MKISLFKKIKHRFYLISVLLMLLFCFGYFELAIFLNKLSTSTHKAQKTYYINNEIIQLKELFWKLRFWERAVQTQCYAIADKEFGKTIDQMRKKIEHFDPGEFADKVHDIKTNINSLLTKYESAFSSLTQYETNKRLNRTNLDSNYQVISSSILIKNNHELLKPLLNLNRFMDNYLHSGKDSKYQALILVFSFFKSKLQKNSMIDDRMASYINKYEELIKADFEYEKQIRVINKQFDEISLNLMKLLLDIYHKVEILSDEAITTSKHLLKTVHKWFFISSCIAFIILLCILNIMAKKIIRPIQELSEVVNEVKSGNENARFKSEINDEFAELGFALNDMLDTIRLHRLKLEDIVEERTAELRSTNNKMRLEIDQRKIAEEHANQMAIEAEIANKAKSAFLANMSHEIRTPMNAVINMTELALNTELTSKQKEYLNIIKNSGSNLLGIINDILDISKIESGKLELEKSYFDLNEVFDSISDMFRDRAYKNNIEFIISIQNNLPLSLIGDPLRLKQILVNITNNAFKFTKNGEIVIQVMLISKDIKKAVLIFTIKDSGIGISEENIKKLFTPFTQEDTSTTRKYGGTGLGLAICKQLTELMKGKIWVKSKKGQGSLFSFTAEFALQSKQQSELKLISKLQYSNALVVSNNNNQRQIIRSMLESFGFYTIASENGEDALRIIDNNKENSQQKINLIVMECDMIGISGITTLGKIKKDENLNKIKIIMFGKSSMEENVTMADAFISKPVLPHRLYEKICIIFSIKYKTAKYQNKVQKIIDFNIFKNIKILLTEDNLFNQKVAIEIMKQIGIDNIDIANNGNEAVKAISNNKYDIVLMDVQMPEMDGFQATKIIREDKQYNNLPIIAMTANALKGDRERCIEIGMNDYIAKPINQKEFVNTIKKWIEKNK